MNIMLKLVGAYKSHSLFFLSFPEMVVDLDHLVVQLIHAVEQSHSKGVCHGEFHWQ